MQVTTKYAAAAAYRPCSCICLFLLWELIEFLLHVTSVEGWYERCLKHLHCDCDKAEALLKHCAFIHCRSLPAWILRLALSDRTDPYPWTQIDLFSTCNVEKGIRGHACPVDGVQNVVVPVPLLPYTIALFRSKPSRCLFGSKIYHITCRLAS